jgi:hypothetical protein
MATVTASNSTKPTSTDESPADKLSGAAQKIREQVLSSVKQSQQLSIDAAQGWAKAVSALPVPDLPTIPGVPSVPSLEAATKYSFDFASELLSGQRDFALRLTNVLVPAKTS